MSESSAHARPQRNQTMALRPTKVGSKDSDIETAPRAVDQRRQPEQRFRLQVDRQTKNSFGTLKAAVEAGTKIKKAFPVVQVSIYDGVDGVNQLVGPDGLVEPEPEKAE
jgi:hypothetical protein